MTDYTAPTLNPSEASRATPQATMEVADYVAQFLREQGITHVFGVIGGSVIRLIDAVGRADDITYIAMQHEQAAAMAAEGYARVANDLGAAMVTTGPGGTNAITGVGDAWLDSIPMIVISGQVKQDNLKGSRKIRNFASQELDICAIVAPITKYATMVRDPKKIRYHLERACHTARTGRPGPVWLDIPIDVQSARIVVDELEAFDSTQLPPPTALTGNELAAVARRAVEMLERSTRPVIVAGHGVRLGGAEAEVAELASLLHVPVVTGMKGVDLLAEHEMFFGHAGTYGTRFGNFILQNSDHLLAIGARLHPVFTGHNVKAFARAATKVMVDIDRAELEKQTVNPDLAIEADVKGFTAAMIREVKARKLAPKWTPWVDRANAWRKKYPVCKPAYFDEKGFVNSYVLVERLAHHLATGDVIVTGDATSLICMVQGMKFRKGQRLLLSSGSGMATMGFDLPGAIGACFASGGRVICFTGDGSVQMNLQELQTVVTHNIPVKTFVINNDGYLTIRISQDDWFGGRYTGTNRTGGYACPDMVAIGNAYGMKTTRVDSHADLDVVIRETLESPGPALCEVMMRPDQKLEPLSGYGERPDGSRYPLPLEDMVPQLERAEFLSNMIIAPWPSDTPR